MPLVNFLDSAKSSVDSSIMMFHSPNSTKLYQKSMNGIKINFVYIGNPNQTRHLDVHHEEKTVCEKIGLTPFIRVAIFCDEVPSRHKLCSMVLLYTQELE